MNEDAPRHESFHETQAKARAEEVLTEVSSMIGRAVEDLKWAPGNAETVVQGGFPFLVVGRKSAAPVIRREGKDDSPIRILGRDVVVDDENNGVWVDSNTATPEGGFEYRVLGERFHGKQAIAADVVRGGRGGLLMFEYTLTARQSDGFGPVTVDFAREVDLQLFDPEEVPASSFPTVAITHWDALTEAWQIVNPSGVVYQLCAHFDANNRVTIYQRIPQVRFQGEGVGGYNNTFFTIIG